MSWSATPIHTKLNICGNKKHFESLGFKIWLTETWLHGSCKIKSNNLEHSLIKYEIQYL